MERSLNPIENFRRGTRFLGGREGFQAGGTQIPDPGPVSYQGPGPANYIYDPSNADVINKKISNTQDYRERSTFIKVFPICGTPGYFSLQSSLNDRLYLCAYPKGNEVVARVIGVDNTIELTNAACWREIPCTEANTVKLENKGYPGLYMTADGKTITVISGAEKDKACFLKSPANTSPSVIFPKVPKSLSDMEVRDGWNLSDDRRTFGRNPSYELDPTYTRTWQECAEKALIAPDANGFVFIKPGDSFGTCRTKVGGYWDENRTAIDAENHKGSLISGIFN